MQHTCSEKSRYALEKLKLQAVADATSLQTSRFRKETFHSHLIPLERALSSQPLRSSFPGRSASSRDQVNKTGPPVESLRESPSRFSVGTRAPRMRRLRLQLRPRSCLGLGRRCPPPPAPRSRPRSHERTRETALNNRQQKCQTDAETHALYGPPASPRLRDRVRHHAGPPAPGRSRAPRPEGRGENVIDRCAARAAGAGRGRTVLPRGRRRMLSCARARAPVSVGRTFGPRAKAVVSRKLFGYIRERTAAERGAKGRYLRRFLQGPSGTRTIIFLPAISNWPPTTRKASKSLAFEGQTRG